MTMLTDGISDCFEAEIKLNLENVLLVGCRLLTGKELEQCAADPDKSVKKKLLEKYREEKSYCFSPFKP